MRFKRVISVIWAVLVPGILVLSLSGCISTRSFDESTVKLFQETLDTALNDAGIPGAVATIIDPDGAKWNGASGVSDIPDQTPMSSNLKFRIGSVTKTFTAVVTLQLVQEGKISLDQSLESVLPGIVPGGDKIKIRQLLNHTSGLFDYVQSGSPDFFAEAAANHLKQWKPDELLAISRANQPYFAPGDGVHYSNTNYLLLGMIIEKITGKTVADEVTARILVPLKMNNTSIPVSPDMPEGSTHGYTWEDTAWVDVTRFDPSWAGSAGNMISNTDDLLIWLEALVQKKLINQALADEMFTFVELNSQVKFGLGLTKLLDIAVGHSGDFVYGGQAAMYQAKGWKLVVQTNGSPSIINDMAGSEYIMFKLMKAAGLY